MLVLFQRKIIYMGSLYYSNSTQVFTEVSCLLSGYVPPDARYQELHKDVTPAKGLSCEEVQIQGEGQIKLHGLLVRRELGALSAQEPKAVIVYLQGGQE